MRFSCTRYLVVLVIFLNMMACTSTVVGFKTTVAAGILVDTIVFKPCRRPVLEPPNLQWFLEARVLPDPVNCRRPSSHCH